MTISMLFRGIDASASYTPSLRYATAELNRYSVWRPLCQTSYRLKTLWRVVNVGMKIVKALSIKKSASLPDAFV